MKWVSGLRFSIPYLAGQLPCYSPLLPSPILGETDDKEWLHRFGALGVVGLLDHWASDVYAYLYISDFRLYVVFYISDVYFICWISSVDVDFQIFIYIIYYLLYYFKSDRCHKNIRRNTFMAWIALLRCLPTKDRLRRWGMIVAGECVLCSSALETHHHLFFECIYSSSFWLGFVSQIMPNPPLDLHAAAAWVVSSTNRISRNKVTLLKLIFQSIIYLIWKERNVRIFTSMSTSSRGTHLAPDKLLCDRLLSFPATSLDSPSLLLFLFYLLSSSLSCSFLMVLVFWVVLLFPFRVICCYQHCEKLKMV